MMDSLPTSTETGTTGIFHLKRFWAKTLSNTQNSAEWQHDMRLLDILGIGLLPTFDYLYNNKPSFTAFEQWIANHHGGTIPADLVQQCNSLQTGHFSNNGTGLDDVLSAEDMAFWETNGYVIVRNAIPPEDCAAARTAIWEYLGMSENEPATWYRPHNELQGIMVPLYRHPALDKNRVSPIIRRAFEQIWGHTQLVVTTDKAGFNPPETAQYRYRGIGLHWDISLVPPVSFGVQGILYLTDTAAHQGALTVVPGFHRIINDWLLQQPPNSNPRETDFAPFHPMPIAANAGDFIIWHHALPHGSSPNRANSPRLVQYLYWYPVEQQGQPDWA